MLFSSTVFLFLFLPIALIIYYNPILKNRKFRNIFLLIASLAILCIWRACFYFFNDFFYYSQLFFWNVCN